MKASTPNRSRAALRALLVVALALFGMQRVRAAPGDTLFYDNLNGNLNAWTIVASGGDASLGNETSSQGQSLRLRWGPVEIHTDPIDAAVPGAQLDLWIRRGDDAFSEDPDGGEDLVIEFRDSAGSWIVLDTFLGNGTPGEIYTPSYALPAQALHANLSLRLRLLAGNGSDNDYWHVDELEVTETAGAGGGLGVGSCEDFESGLGSWTISAAGGNAGISAQTASSPSNSLYTRAGQVSVTSNAVDLSAGALVSLTVWIRKGDDSFSENPDNGEDLALEYYASTGSWIGLETFAGGGTQGEIFVRSYTLAADALHAGFRIRVRQTAGNGNDLDYWHVDDVCLTDSQPISYSFEESAWTGAAGEVLDASSNGLNGTVFGGAANDATNPAIATNPGTCRYADFDGVDDYIEIPDDAALDMSNELTVAAWINMRTLPAELHTIVSKDTNYEFHIDDQGRVYWWWQADNFRTNGFSITLNQWHHIAITFRSGSQVIYVDGVPRATNNYIGTLSQNDLPLYIGTDWNFISRAFDGFIDEVYVLPMELSQADVQTLMNQTHDCASAAAQFTINHDNFGIHCVDETIVVDVVDSVAGTPLLNYNAQVELDTQSGAGSWTLVAGSGAFNDAAAGDGLATYDWPLGESQSVFALSYPQGPPSIDIDVVQVSDPGIRDTDAEGNLVFSANGFMLTAAQLGNPPVPPVAPFSAAQTAAVPFDVYIAAYGQTPDDPVCGVIESYTGNKNLKFWSQYVNPGSGTLNVAINGNPIPALEATAVNQIVSFSNGQGQISAKYDDVGSKQIWVKDDSTINAELPAGIRGGTADFVSRPASFELAGIVGGAGTPNPQAADASGTKFIGAGQPFEMTVTALDAEGDPTPNYGQEATAESVRLDLTLVSPSGGASPGLGPALGFGAFSGGSATGSSFFWDEVGVIRLTPRVGDGNYLGAGDTVGAVSENIGRFVPDHFAVSWVAQPVFRTMCSDGDFDGDRFTYEGQPFGYVAPPVLQFVAQTAGNNLTQNYQTFPSPGERFFKMSTAQLAMDGNKQYLEGTGALDWTDVPAADPVVAEVGPGVGTLTFTSGPTGLFFTRSAASAPNPDYNAAISLSLVVVDGDGVGAVGNPINYAIPFSDGANIRYGRMRFTNAVGSERIDLAVPLAVEYYAGPGVGFVANSLDTCTINVALAFSNFTENLTAADTCVLDTGFPGASNIGCAAAGPVGRQFSEPPAAGDFNLWLKAPGVGHAGSVQINAAVPAWLRYDWDLAAPGDEDPVGQATFGLFKGETSQIYLREIYR